MSSQAPRPPRKPTDESGAEKPEWRKNPRQIARRVRDSLAQARVSLAQSPAKKRRAILASAIILALLYPAAVGLKTGGRPWSPQTPVRTQAERPDAHESPKPAPIGRAIERDKNDDQIAALIRQADRRAGPNAPTEKITKAIISEAEDWRSAARIRPPNARAQDGPAQDNARNETAAPPKAKLAPAYETRNWWRRAQAHQSDGTSRIVVVVDDLGLDRAGTARALALPPPLTLSFLSYAPNLPAQLRESAARGHEPMLHVPMEPKGNLHPGPFALRSDLSDEKIARYLKRALNAAQSAEFVGINNHMGSHATTDPRLMSLVLRGLGDRGLLFLDSRTTPHSAAAKLARELGVAFAERDVFLDHEPERARIQEQIQNLEKIARRQGYAIAIAHPHPETLKALREWLPTLNERGFSLTPLSALVARAEQGHLPRASSLR